MTVNPPSGDADDDLVLEARCDRDAFGRLFDRFYPIVFAYCLRRLVVRAVAEDVTSEVFLKVTREWQRFPGTCVADFQRWVFRIATNEMNAHWRSTSRRRALLEAAARLGSVKSDLFVESSESPELACWQDIYQAIAELPEREQSVVTLRYLAGLTHQQIASIHEIEVGAARVVLSRALKKLRVRLRDAGGPSESSPGISECRPEHE